MNLYFLVEGRSTEPKVYKEWVKHVFPHLRHVGDIADVTTDCYCIVKGGGIPSILKRLHAALAELGDYPTIDHFFLCVDSEAMPYDAAVQQWQLALENATHATAVISKLPRLQIHLVVQHCCIETWFLGHDKMLRRAPSSLRLVEMKRFYDVSKNDPERMDCPGGYVTKASFHVAYLKEMLRERAKDYSKDHPGVVRAHDYFEALCRRCESTGHLKSLSRLLGIWDGLKQPAHGER